MEIDQEKRIRLNRKLILVILALLIVFGLIQSGMTGTALFLIYKDTRLLKTQGCSRLLKIVLKVYSYKEEKIMIQYLEKEEIMLKM